jgi:hypothetical protein
MGAMASWHDDSDPTLHVIEFPASYTYEELDAQFTKLEAYYQKFGAKGDRRIALMIDLSRAQSSTAKNRERIARAMAETGPILTRILIAQVYVVTSALMRGALSSISWLKPPTWPVKVFPERAEAERWAREQVATARKGSAPAAG